MLDQFCESSTLLEFSFRFPGYRKGHLIAARVVL
jgi:hypothetical protein